MLTSMCTLRAALACLCLGAWISLSRADLADVVLHDGVRLRGDVTELPDEIVLRNAAGELRIRRDQVARVEYLRLSTQPATATAPAPRPAPASRPAREAIPKSQPVSSAPPLRADAAGGAPTSRPELAPAPRISAADINRLRLAEMPLDGPAERVTLRFPRRRGEPDFEALLRDELARTNQLDEKALQTIERGAAHEKLQLALRTTGLRLANHVEVRGDTQVFDAFRKRVLPLAVKGCARSGCHGGSQAQSFRFPGGAQTSDEFAYASFVLLDSLETRDGAVLNRTLPGESLLVHYLLPAGAGVTPHPPTRKGKVSPLLSGTRDPDYQVLLNWISTLQSPRPEYGLTYTLPPGPAASQPADDAEP